MFLVTVMREFESFMLTQRRCAVRGGKKVRDRNPKVVLFYARPARGAVLTAGLLFPLNVSVDQVPVAALNAAQPRRSPRGRRTGQVSPSSAVTTC